MRATFACASIVLALAGGCADDPAVTPNAGAGGTAGAAGMTGGVGGGGVGGGGVGGGGAGGVGGGGAGGMGGDGTPEGCTAAVPGMPADLHAAAAAVLTAQGKCSFSGTCHDGPNRTAGLNMLDAPDLNMLLVDKPSCLSSVVPLVASGGGETALQNSWLWLKLVAPADASGVLTANTAWGTAGVSCNQMSGQPYGVRMPWGTTEGYTSEERLSAIRNWICAGAPGPM